jgi:glutathione S-transferase
MLRIYNFARGARGLRIMWQCEEMGLPYEVERVGYPVSEAYRARHPLGSVPFLEDDAHGVAMSESVAIMLYLAQQYGPTPLLPLHKAAHLARTLQMAEFGEAALGAAINPQIATRFAAPEADRSNWSVSWLEKRTERGVEFTAALLGEAAWLTGDELTLADISIVPALVMWRGIFKKELPERLAAYVERAIARPAYRSARVRCDGEQSSRP